MLTIVFLWWALLTPVHANLRITIWVVNSTVVPVKTLAKAENIAGQIFSHAGIAVIYVDCAAADLQLEVLTRRPVKLHSDMTGFAVLTPAWRDGASYAGVFYPMVEAAAKSQEVEASYILGVTMAHEIGHLLLGATSHTAKGVMSPRLRPEQLRMAARGELLFTPEQAVRIRSEVARRMAR